MKNINANIETWDEALVNWSMRAAVPFAKFSIFLVYFYFGAIKVFFENGAANPMVVALLHKTMPGVPAGSFLIAFGVYEMIVGLLFLLPNFHRLGLFFLAIHMITTIMPLFILPQFTWASFMVPTIEGQYIIKNILIIALAIVVYASLRPLKEEKPNV